MEGCGRVSTLLGRQSHEGNAVHYQINKLRARLCISQLVSHLKTWHSHFLCSSHHCSFCVLLRNERIALPLCTDLSSDVQSAKRADVLLIYKSVSWV